MELERARLAEALTELYELLEQYAPPWYTEEHHERAESALTLVKSLDKRARERDLTGATVHP